MPEHTSWLNWAPGYHALEAWIEGFGKGWLLGSSVHVQHVAAALLVLVLLTLLAVLARNGLKKGDILPDEKLTPRNIVELLIEGVLSIMTSAMSRDAALRHLWVIGPLGFFILFSNLLGMIPGFLPPTESFNTTFACATLVFVYYNAYAFYRLGLGHLAHLANPVGEWWGWFLAPLFLPVELISHFIRPVSLSVRLLCNIAGDHLVMAAFLGLLPIPLFYPIPILALGLFVAFIQAFVFLLLSSVYIGEVEANIEHHLAHRHGHDDVRAAGHQAQAAH
ncbi:MAG: F0F1 ATP synthase subunit A [Deltaproteobacteria bacterium]|nr:F0F1 ATP synthase subunit A [Deltaproteobacteria bacterium]